MAKQANWSPATEWLEQALTDAARGNRAEYLTALHELIDAARGNDDVPDVDLAIERYREECVNPWLADNSAAEALAETAKIEAAMAAGDLASARRMVDAR